MQLFSNLNLSIITDKVLELLMWLKIKTNKRSIMKKGIEQFSEAEKNKTK